MNGPERETSRKEKKRGRIGFILILLLAIIVVAGTYYTKSN